MRAWGTGGDTALKNVSSTRGLSTEPYLNNLLLKYCEAALTDRRGNVSQLRTRVENAISSLLPHGRVVVDDVARSLGMSKKAGPDVFRVLSKSG